MANEDDEANASSATVANEPQSMPHRLRQAMGRLTRCNVREGTSFGRAAHQRASGKFVLTRWTATISLSLAIVGAALLGLGTAEWTFDPAGWLHVKSAALNVTLQIGAKP
ncbi:MAG: hypothetical protein HC777_01955 [Hyphomonadaceae bacterium]|nr:hypothetical protein [Hyphomonadaceae bacterium]